MGVGPPLPDRGQAADGKSAAIVWASGWGGVGGLDGPCWIAASLRSQAVPIVWASGRCWPSPAAPAAGSRPDVVAHSRNVWLIGCVGPRGVGHHLPDQAATSPTSQRRAVGHTAATSPRERDTGERGRRGRELWRWRPASAGSRPSGYPHRARRRRVADRLPGEAWTTTRLLLRRSLPRLSSSPFIRRHSLPAFQSEDAQIGADAPGP